MFLHLILLVGFSLQLSYIWNVIGNWRKRRATDAVTPPKVWAFLPFIGSAIEMGQDIRAFILKYSRKFDSPIFTATIGGVDCHFLAASEDTTMIHGRNKSLDGDTLGQQFIENVCGGVGVKECYKDRAFLTKTMKNVQAHIWPMEALNKLVNESQSIINERFHALEHGIETGNWKKIGLYDFCLNHIYCASVAPVISVDIATEEYAREFATFEKAIPLLFGGLPSFLAKKQVNARDSIVSRLGNLSKPSQLLRDRQVLFECFPSILLDRINFSIIFAAVGNSIPSVFWTLAHIMKDPKALSSVRNEIDQMLAAKRAKGDKSEALTFDEMDQLETLKSAFQEAIRLYGCAFSPRQVLEDFIYQSKAKGGKKFLFKRGTRIMSFFQIRHYDSEIFENPKEFRYDRFMPDSVTGKPPVFTKNGKIITDPLKAFGGGEHMCPGRRFIGYEARHFLACLFSKFDLRFAEGDSLPSIDKSLQGLGVGQPGGELYIEITPRKSS